MELFTQITGSTHPGIPSFKAGLLIKQRTGAKNFSQAGTKADEGLYCLFYYKGV